MDELTRKLEQLVVNDPSLRPQLLAAYMREGSISSNTILYCAELGEPISGQVLPSVSKKITESNYPKKLYLVFGLGCVDFMEHQIGEAIDESLSYDDAFYEGFEELRSYVALCRKFSKQVLPAFLAKHDETFDYDAGHSFYNGLTMQEYRGLLARELQGRIRRTEYSIASPQHLVMPDFLRAYFSSYASLAIACSKKPKNNVIDCCSATAEALILEQGGLNITKLVERTHQVENQGLHFMFKYFLGPLIVS